MYTPFDLQVDMSYIPKGVSTDQVAAY